MPTLKSPSRRKSRKRRPQVPDYRELSIPERIHLAQEILGSIVDEQACPPMTEEEKKIFDQRLDAYYAAPYEGDSWEDLKKKLLKR